MSTDTIQWGEMIATDLGIRIEQADPFIKVSLELVVAGTRLVAVSRDRITFGTGSGRVSYKVIGWEPGTGSLLCEKDEG